MTERISPVVDIGKPYVGYCSTHQTLGVVANMTIKGISAQPIICPECVRSWADRLARHVPHRRAEDQ